DPAQRFVALPVVARGELVGHLGQIEQDCTRLREGLAARFQNRRLAHLVDALAPLRVSRRAFEEIDERRLPVEPGAIQIERDLVGVSGLGKAMELVFGHGAVIPLRYRLKVGTLACVRRRALSGSRYERTVAVSDCCDGPCNS